MDKSKWSGFRHAIPNWILRKALVVGVGFPDAEKRSLLLPQGRTQKQWSI